LTPDHLHFGDSGDKAETSLKGIYDGLSNSYAGWRSVLVERGLRIQAIEDSPLGHPDSREKVVVSFRDSNYSGFQKVRSYAREFCCGSVRSVKNNMAILNIHRNHTAGVIYSR
jgi:hypothetical protein